MKSRLIAVKQRRKQEKKVEETKKPVPLVGQICTNCQGSGVCNTGAAPQPTVRGVPSQITTEDAIEAIVNAEATAEVKEDPLAMPPLVRANTAEAPITPVLTSTTGPEIAEQNLTGPTGVTGAKGCPGCDLNADCPVPDCDYHRPRRIAAEEAKLEAPTPETVQSLQARLVETNKEIARLKQVVAAQTGKGISISYPLPHVTGYALIDPEKLEQAKAIFSGLILELINTTYNGLETQNRKAYSFYDIDQEKREVKMTFAETSGL